MSCGVPLQERAEFVVVHAAAPMASVVGALELSAAVPFDDGFKPVSTSQPGRLLRQEPPRKLPPGLVVLKDAVSDATARRAFEYTASRPKSESQQWGTYLEVQGEDEAGDLVLQRRGEEPEVRGRWRVPS